MEDWLKCQLSPLVKYIAKTVYRCSGCLHAIKYLQCITEYGNCSLLPSKPFRLAWFTFFSLLDWDCCFVWFVTAGLCTGLELLPVFVSVLPLAWAASFKSLTSNEWLSTKILLSDWSLKSDFELLECDWLERFSWRFSLVGWLSEVSSGILEAHSSLLAGFWKKLTFNKIKINEVTMFSKTVPKQINYQDLFWWTVYLCVFLCILH